MPTKRIIPLQVQICLYALAACPDSPYRIVHRTVILIIGFALPVYFEICYCIAFLPMAELTVLVDNLIVLLANLYVIAKVVMLWFNYERLCELFQTMSEGLNNDKMDDEDKRYMTKSCQLSQRIANFFLCVNSVLCLLYHIFGKPEELQPDPKNRRYLLKMKVPFPTWDTPVYQIYFFLQMCGSYWVSILAGMLMALGPALVLYAGSLFDILCRDIRRLSTCDEKDVPVIVKRVVAQHQKAIRYTENVQNVLLYQSLVQFFTNILTSCCLAFILINSLSGSGGYDVFLKILFYYITANSEAFIICYVGEYITAKSESIHETVYDIQWYNFSMRDCRTIMFIMLRAQKRLTLMAGKIIVLNMETFASMLKLSASYTSVLLAME